MYGNAFSGMFKYYQFKNSDDEREMKEPHLLKPGVVYGMSNGSLDEWDKVNRGKAAF